MKPIINLNTREGVIEFLSMLPKCEDITSEVYPTRVGKKYFKYKFKRNNSIHFDINYNAYDELCIWDSRRTFGEYVKFKDFSKFVIDKKIFREPSDSEDIIIGEKKIILL